MCGFTWPYLFLGGLCGCWHLQKLTIDRNLLVNCAELELLPYLQIFSCAENHIHKITTLHQCSLLTVLHLQKNNLQEVHILKYTCTCMYHGVSGDGTDTFISPILTKLLKTLERCISERTPPYILFDGVTHAIIPCLHTWILCGSVNSDLRTIYVSSVWS